MRRVKHLLAAIWLAVIMMPVGRAATPENAGLCLPVAPRPLAIHAFGEQESLTFIVHWGIVKAGRAILAIESVEPIQGRPAYHLSMDIHSAGLTNTLHPYSDRTDSWLDRDSLVTARYLKRVRQSHYKDDETVEFNQACHQFEKHENRIDKGKMEDQHGLISPYTLDTYGALFYLRTLPLAPGGHYDLELFTGDRVLPITAIVRKKVRINVGAGRFDCFLVEPTLRDSSGADAKVKQIQWWLSTDDRHLPVRLRMEVAVGHIVADLSSVNPKPR